MSINSKVVKSLKYKRNEYFINLYDSINYMLRKFVKKSDKKKIMPLYEFHQILWEPIHEYYQEEIQKSDTSDEKDKL